MGVSHSFPDFQKKIGDAAKNLKAAEKPAVIAGGKVVERVFTVTKDAMGAGGKRGATVKNTATTSNGHPGQLVKFGPNPGWVAILDRPTKAHLIRPLFFHGTKSQGKRAKKGAAFLAAFGIDAHVGGGVAALKFKDGNIRGSARHPGTKGKHFVEVAQKAAPKPAAAEMQKVLLKEFGKSFK